MVHSLRGSMFEYPCTYDFPPYRPPNEADSALIRITRGCPWNRCEFCSMYKQMKFELRSLDEIMEDILTARKIYGRVRTVFLGDSDNLVHNDLPLIISRIRSVFPEAERVTAYARARTLLSRKMEFLIDVCEAGLDRLHIGLESGDPVVLEKMRKGVTPDEMIRAGRRAREAGFEISFYVLCGAGGRDRRREHALESARVCNETKPDFIRLRTLTVLPGTQLHVRQSTGEFVITKPRERLKEVLLFIENFDLSDCHLASDHLTNYLWAGHTPFYRGVAGLLPAEKEGMLSILHNALAFIDSTGLEVKDSNQFYEEGIIPSL